jgi:phosphohistidine phosphatase
MKTLILIRHAKSSWANIGETDFERPLNERGKKDAPEMAKKLFESNIKIDAFVSSPAKRAKKTCKAFMEVYGREKENIILVDELYIAQVAAFYKVVSNLNKEHNDVALFSHNPGISAFANSLCKGVDIDDMPTCAVFAVQISIEDWKDFETAEKRFSFFKYPKQD